MLLLFLHLKKSTGTTSEYIPHWRRTETTVGRGWCHDTERTEDLFQTSVSTEVHPHRGSSHLSGNSPPFISLIHNSSDLSHTRAQHWDRCLNTCLNDCNLPVCHLGRVVGGNVAVTVCGCWSHHHKIAIAVGENKQPWLTVHVKVKTRVKVKHEGLHDILWYDGEPFTKAHGQFCVTKRRVVIEGYNHTVLSSCREKEGNEYIKSCSVCYILS